MLIFGATIGGNIHIWVLLDIGWIKTARCKKQIFAFRCFYEQHSAHNIYSKLQSIFDEYKITNKIFAVGFDNASNNTDAIPAFRELCLPYLEVNFFTKDVFVMF